MEKASITAVKALESSNSAHKRIDEQNTEILSLRNHRHESNNMLQAHQNILSGISGSISTLGSIVKDQTKVTERNTKTLVQFKTMAITAIFMGGGFIGFCIFVGGDLLKWW